MFNKEKTKIEKKEEEATGTEMLTYTTTLNAFQLGKTSGWLIKKSLKENILKAFFDILISFRVQMFTMPGYRV